MGYFFVNFTKNLCNYPEIAAVSGENENFLGSLQIIHFLIFQHSHVSIFSMLVHFFVQLSLKQTVAPFGCLGVGRNHFDKSKHEQLL